MRILIVGGGIAGLTLAALLRQRGMRPLIVEKSHGYGGVGYVLGLWSLGSRVLKGLGLYDSPRMLPWCRGSGLLIGAASTASVPRVSLDRPSFVGPVDIDLNPQPRTNA